MPPSSPVAAPPLPTAASPSICPPPRTRPIFRAVEASLRHQIDIVADCGAEPRILDFFKSQEIVVKPGQGDGGGRFSANSKGVSVDVAVDAPEKPVMLHELLHAYHWRVLPDAFRNPDVLRFYGRAKEGEFYPVDSYVLKNVQEFFAVTGSLYLWGNVDRPPHNRRNAARQAAGLLQMARRVVRRAKDA